MAMLNNQRVTFVEKKNDKISGSFKKNGDLLDDSVRRCWWLHQKDHEWPVLQ
jgi:hypothetical protein